MSAAALFDPLAELLNLEPVERCRFCGCTDDAPCAIPIAQEDGVFRLARNEGETTMIQPCAWFLPAACNAPRCMEKLIAEWGAKVLLFDAGGRKLA